MVDKLKCPLQDKARKIFMNWRKKDLVGYILEFAECSDLVKLIREQERTP